MSARDKLVDQGIEVLARTGPRAIGSFVRTWLWCMAPIFIGLTVLVFCNYHFGTQGGDNVLFQIGFSIFCGGFFSSFAALPVAIVIAVAHIAMKW